jgi:hypothetical protein
VLHRGIILAYPLGLILGLLVFVAKFFLSLLIGLICLFLFLFLCSGAGAVHAAGNMLFDCLGYVLGAGMSTRPSGAKVPNGAQVGRGPEKAQCPN